MEELVKLTCGNKKAMECWSSYASELIPNAAGYFTSDQIIVFLSKHKHFIQDLYLLQHKLCEITLGREKWKLIKLRRVEQFKIWKEQLKQQQNENKSSMNPLLAHNMNQQQEPPPVGSVYPLGKSTSISPNTSPTHSNNNKKEKHSFFSFFTGLFRREKKKKELSDYSITNEEYQEILDSILHFFYLRYHPINTDDIPAEAPRIKELKKIGSTYTIPGVRMERLERPSLDTINLIDEDFCMVDPIPEAERVRVLSESHQRLSNTNNAVSPSSKYRASPLRKEIRSIQTREVALSGRSEQYAGAARSKRGTEVSISVPGEVMAD